MFGSSIIQHPEGTFGPLKCNKDLENDPCLTPWSSKFGTGLVITKTVEIPCGTCIVMNPLSGPLELRGGLVVLGKLYIPDGVQIEIQTTGILVHGKLIMESSKPIDGNPDIKISFLDSDRDINFRLPPGEGSEDVCGGKYGSCDVGQKPFVIAGGEVDFRGLPSPSMPSWVPLYDIDDSLDGWSVPREEYSTFLPPKHGCPKDGILIHHDFSDPFPQPAFTGSFGSIFEFTSNSLKVTNRTHTQHCPVVDLKYVRHCINANQTLLLTARVLLTQAGKVDKTDCARGLGEDKCMSIYEGRMNSRGIGRTSAIWKEKRSFQSMLGEEQTIAIEFNFTDSELDEDNIFEILQLRGPSAGVDMELLDFTLRYPPSEALPNPDNVCGDLVQNGDAELLGLSPFPFRTNNQETHLSVIREDNGNRYFEVRGREFAVQNAGKGTVWRSSGITFSVPPSCLKTHTKYAFQADVRMQSLRDVTSTWKIRGFLPKMHNPITETIATCEKSKGNWVTCTGDYQPSSEIVAAERLEVVLETDTSSFDVNYDVDNVSFRPTEGGLIRLILPKSVENLWSPGAEILITSPSTRWDGHSVRKIASVENHDEEGYVRVQLNEAIPRPLTLGSHPYHATEVALLSRNIVFDGKNGGHFTVLHSPQLTQVIQGVEFVRFGEEGKRDRFPILFDNCQDSANSVVSKNTIRHSNQRCVVLDTTSNVLVEGNVAFDTRGHCFVVESGLETGNVFKSNLGAYTRRVHTLMPQAGISGKET